MQGAVEHARIYCELIKGYTPDKHQYAEARSHQNVGMLYEVLGEHQRALQHYKQYLSMSKQRGHKKGIAQAYGCLGSIYAQLRNRQLSLTYHEQHINMARKLNDQALTATALELMGDSFMLLEEFEHACEKFDEMFQNCPRVDLKMRTTSLCKLGRAYLKQKRFQYALFYFEQARDIAQEFDYLNVKVMCDFNIACMLQHSTQHTDLDKAYELFRKLIPMLEAKYLQHQEEDTFCPSQLLTQIQDCYNGIQNVLGKIGNGNLCLQYSEAQKRKHITQVLTGQVSAAGASTYGVSNVALYDAWSVERITRVVSQQNATVLMYQLQTNQILMWLIKPGEGVVRFYAGKGLSTSKDCIDELRSLIGQIREQRDSRHAQYECENRCLSLRDAQLDRVRLKNRKLGADFKKEEYRAELAKEIEERELSEKELARKQKSPERQLFDMLIAPVYDVLENLEEFTPLVIVPDKVLHECPFAVLKDWYNKMMTSRFRITVCPSLLVLDRVVHNELHQLKLQDDLDFERTQARLGGIPKVMQNIDFMRLNMGSPDYICLPDGRLESRDSSNNKGGNSGVNLRRVANPRLVTSGALSNNYNLETGPLGGGVGKPHRETTLLSVKSKSSLNSLKNAPFTPRTKQQLLMTSARRDAQYAATEHSKTKTHVTGAPTTIGTSVCYCGWEFHVVLSCCFSCIVVSLSVYSGKYTYIKLIQKCVCIFCSRL